MSVQQIEALMDYLEGHPELALGRCARSKEGRSLSKRLWQECGALLNSVSADCVQKTGEQWRTFFNEYKHRMLKKIKKSKNEMTATGGGPHSPQNLSPLQERLYNILGRDVGNPLPGVRHNPFPPVEDPGNINVVIEEFVEVESRMVDFSTSIRLSGEGQSEPVGSHTPERLQAQMQAPLSEGTQPTDTVEPAASQGSQNPRPRRRRRRQVSDRQDSNPTAVLTELEERSVQASHRVAAAIEALTARLNEPIHICISLGEKTTQPTPPRRRST